ncbi:hypothetical protein [Nonomuraea sp. NPDC050786]|uniref:hypothetical protein n=1 Tax=Nonomuraea sp. NPDC050786 TaxID=3154840 RepID=UPI0033FF3252
MGTLVVFVGSIFLVSTPTAASAAVTKQFSYTCQGTLLSATSQTISVGLSAPDTVTAGASFDLTVNIPALTLAAAPTAATTLQVSATLTPSTGTVDTGQKTGASVTTSTSVPAKEVTYKVTVPTGTTSNVTVKPGQLMLSLASSVNTSATCTTTSTESLSVPIGTGGGNGSGEEIVKYDCGVDSFTGQDVEIKVELTMPTSAKVGEQFIIKWKGTYTQGKELKAPTTGQTISPKIFPYASLTGISGLTSATGEGSTGTITAGGIITLPTTQIDLKTTANTAGTATVKPGKINFGSNASTGNQPAIECTVENESALKTYTLTVSSSTASPTPTPTPTPTTTSPKPTKTSTHTVTITPSSKKTTKSKTPKAGADTGGGGEMGPDGRLFILTGTALIAAAAVGGLIMRRRSIRS